MQRTLLPHTRLEGIDLARFLALVGMVIVNFDMVMTGGDAGFGIAQLLQGRAAALFVVLAGIGLGLGSARKDIRSARVTTAKRGMFLLAAGLLNMLIFDADIIHYYAFYFFCAIWFLRASSFVLWAAILALPIVFLTLVFTLDFDVGWDWENYKYSGFWTPKGFVRNLFFNGWHPIVPWLSFLLFGLWLSRLDLKVRRVQKYLAGIGASVLVGVTLVSNVVIDTLGVIDTDLPLLFAVSPVPPMPLYMIAGCGFASMCIGLCLWAEPYMKQVKILSAVTPAGRQTLTLYVAHILIGMGTMEVLGLIEGQTSQAALLASFFFCALSIIYAYVWARMFKRGPLEGLMRAMTK